LLKNCICGRPRVAAAENVSVDDLFAAAFEHRLLEFEFEHRLLEFERLEKKAFRGSYEKFLKAMFRD
jgi:hypothetical protein